MSRGRASRFLRVLSAAAVVAQAAVWIRASMWYPQLPSRFPIHFDGAGNADSWVNTTPVAWFGLCVIPLALGAFLGAIARWMTSLTTSCPALVNVPRKDLFLKLSPEGRGCVARPVQLHLVWTVLLVTMLFTFIQEGTARVAVGAWTKLPPWPVFAFIGGVVLPLPWLMIATRRAVETTARAEGVDGA
ncbi:MAG: DUF1648 domain-containing protein [Phycisphaerales bacterium]